ncbi:DUF4307 domain-containing protein [Ornithinimicrobium pratense]|uniref:DUF4307 domain-containing protein n=1 Tax=Ornithinimicrobium pratense TaxID=2593973 RepID=UPI001787D63F|nr:DUF4307 domain-containing protein [Ornithinimicrobium pratense]
MTTPPPTEHHQRSDEADPVVDWDAEEEAVEAARPARQPNARRWWIFGGTAVAIMVVMAVIWGLSATVGRVHWTYTGHDLVAEDQVDVRLDLQRDPERAVTCRIEARDERNAVVGRADVEIGPAQSSPSRHVLSVRSASPPRTGYVDACWYSDEPPRR